MPPFFPRHASEPRPSAPRLLIFLLGGTLLALAGCGNKGPLYLPSSPEAQGGPQPPARTESQQGDTAPASSAASR